ncbi:aldo/keto reductase [Halopseudomonas nanhaiensis]|uniref:aldo/keto reductase n=1 Tax=Halopseudomonas nanhaiensis TaxID=2830842 RepID=UPI001CBADAAF|nr:aldo/keto reductase [Halopseudomonas nanhaiensis]UAW99610.1 aldo/keto reductase [Halopseudomonas nanhaiensis]
MNTRITRRHSLKFIGATLAAMMLPSASLFASNGGLRHKAYAGTDRTLPVIGMGTWRTFNVGNDPKLLNARAEVVKAFFELGGQLIDSSPMYGSASETIGHALQQLGTPNNLFAAEKVWSPAGGSTREQVATQQAHWTVEQLDLVQVHNLADWREHLAVLRELKAEGKIRHVGITTSHGRRHSEMEQIMSSEDIDFVQLTYNITHREAEDRLLPLAQERNIGVIANRPYDGGGLIKRLKRRDEPLPEWARAECGCFTWADFLLKFIVSHPAMTCAIPATTQVAHMRENMRAGHDPMPSPDARKRMAAYIESL